MASEPAEAVETVGAPVVRRRRRERQTAAEAVEQLLAGEAPPGAGPTEAALPPAGDHRSRGADVPRGERSGGASRHSAEVDEMVRRCLDPAVGLCMRAFDRDDGDPALWRSAAREAVSRGMADAARRRVGGDDATAHRVMRSVAEHGLDQLVGHPGSVPLPAGVDLATFLPAEAPPSAVFPDHRVHLAALQDTISGLRGPDRAVAFVVLAAGLTLTQAATLLDRSAESVEGSLRRVCRRLAEDEMAARIVEGS
jgi:DNA-directed RNA polymerase specialized sigma24 family protein